MKEESQSDYSLQGRGDRRSITSLGDDAVIEKRQSYQIRALARNKLSYQRRQWRTNICCVALCPFMMVALGGIIGILLQGIIEKSFPTRNLLMCANQNASDSFNLPYSFILGDRLPKISGSEIPNAFNDQSYTPINHYLLPISITDETNQQRPYGLYDTEPSCAWSFDNDYPFSDPYQIDPGVPLDERLDTTNRPDPRGGWFGNDFLQQKAFKLIINQKYPWMLVADLSNTGLAGFREETSLIPINTTEAISSLSNNKSPIQSLVSSSQSKFSNSSSAGTGILGQTSIGYYLDIFSQSNGNGFQNPAGIIPLPYYKPSQKNSINEIDDMLADYIRDIIKGFQSVPTNVFNAITANLSDSSAATALTNYFTTVTPIANKMPYGAIIFEKIDTKSRDWKYTLQIGKNNQIESAGTTPPAIEKIIIQQASLGTALLRSATNKPNANIVHQLRAMPQVYYYKFSVPIGSLIGSSLFPFGISFLISIFVLILVKEKEDRILVMMRMNGLKYIYYYLSHYIHFFILTMLAGAFFLGAGIGFKLEMFVETSLGLLILLLVIWGNVQISLSFFFATFFNQAKVAQVIVNLIIVWGVIIDATISFIFTTKSPLPYLIWPPFAVYRAIAKMNAAAVSTERPGYRFSDLKPGDEVFNAFIALGISWVVFMAIAVYLNLVLPNDYGVNKPWHFIFTGLFNKKSAIPKELDSYDESELSLEDSDVKEERRRVLNGENIDNSPLVLRRVRKVYDSGKVAVKDVTFAVDRGNILGLLGPNGAGKTTTISMMTGLYPISSGYATLAGFDVSTETKQVYRHVGICPQYDILWDDLSIEDHLYFYARLKGISPKNEKNVVDQILKDVDLDTMKKKLSKQLSGGQKRRLSIAISLVGNPDVVFLDEPTTGLDPEVRRTVWNIISANREGRTIVITTHSMEEAEVLCNRIGIMAQGTMRCIGSQLRLKQLYGSGFLVSIACSKEFLAGAKTFIESILPPNAKLLDNFDNAASYEFKPDVGSIPHLYRILNAKAQEYHITDWGISQTSLDEVFLRIIGDDDAGAST
ncbi:hypothetical protein BB561_006788 [Smittium simulii]|uniref:ABC transporter domain-containing protein n=1 Tax=Smittium simulii TaxID=133385 RepID=A0A2T9Y1H1_9FUNG|nr:hypothetical protein BB561_006788 [Smittium simulii]